MIKVQDNILTKDECDKIIDYSINLPNYSYFDIGQYHYVELMNKNESFKSKFCDPVLQPAYDAIVNLKNSYVEKFPEVENLNIWDIEYVRFKRWKPYSYYNTWHSEHCVRDAYRVMSFLI